MKILKLTLILLSLSLMVISCSKDEVNSNNPNQPMNPDDPNPITGTVWTGSPLTFEKADGADPNDEANQDRITDNVWITRGNNGGQIFNIKVESSSDKSDSPTDTEWALGKTDNIASLTFDKFRTTIKPKEIKGKDLVLHLISDDIYIDIKFDEWAEGKDGGFKYTRSTQ